MNQISSDENFGTEKQNGIAPLLYTEKSMFSC